MLYKMGDHIHSEISYRTVPWSPKQEHHCPMMFSSGIHSALTTSPWLMMLQKTSVNETSKVPTDVDSTIEFRSWYHPNAGVVRPIVWSPHHQSQK
jgi:hypothetical protein